MADLDDGFTRIANEILEELARRKLNSTQSSIIHFVIRHSYGFQRKSYDMSVGFIADGIGVNPDQVKRELKKLIDWKVVRVFEEATFIKPRVIGMNKDCDEWKAPSHRMQISNEGTNQSPQVELIYKEDLLEVEQESTEGTEQSPQYRNEPTVGANQYPPPGDCLVPQERYSFKDNLKDNIYTVFDHWNFKKIIVHRELNQATKSAINARLQVHDLDSLLEAIDNYHFCLLSEDHYYTYKFILKDFMNPKNVDRFLSENDPFTNFRNRNSGLITVSNANDRHFEKNKREAEKIKEAIERERVGADANFPDNKQLL
ncbi:MAG: hypothetical protein JWM44_1296 [Bacilli bacterium]|nr:hypothetical protein [Bacilli bacterium]